MCKMKEQTGTITSRERKQKKIIEIYKPKRKTKRKIKR